MTSFHLSQPFSRSYRSILPTSLIYVMLLRHQRLLTLRTWCGYRYEMVWKWITRHYFSWSNRNTHCLYYMVIQPTFTSIAPLLKKVIKKNDNLLLKQINTVSLNKWSSTVFEIRMRKKYTESCPPIDLCSTKCFYTEKKTLNWIPIAVIMFI